MTHCIVCHRQLKNPRPSGMGPVCEKRNPPAPAYEPDLFVRFDVDLACREALAWVVLHIDIQAFGAQLAVRRRCADARRRLGFAA